jgi:ferric-dicitrate binding protein FerR (iron transport regulator)
MSDILQKLAVAAPPEDADVAEKRRARVVAGIENAITGEARVKRSRAWRVRAGSALAIAAAAAIAIGAYALTHRTTPVAKAPPMATTSAPIPTVVPEVLAVRVSNGAVLHEHDPLETVSAPLALTFPSTSRVDMTPSSHVMIDFLVSEEAMSIDRGEILVTASRAFRVRALSIEIVAKDAATFDVKITDGKLRVRVDAGEVMVGTDLVKAPGVWPGTGKPQPRAQHHDTSTLADQNALLQSALDSRRHNDDAAAIASLDKLISKYPGSPLIQDARVERMRAYERSGRHAEAVAEAGRYLADFPSGYARDEAKALVIK